MQILHAGQALAAEGWQDDVEIEIGPDGRIATLGPQRRAPDARVDLALPAPANLHSHAFQRAMAGLTEARGPDPSDTFWTWRRLMYRFLDRLTPDDVEAIAALAFMEMAEAGFGAVAEFHYLHHAPGGTPYACLAEMCERIVAAAARTGLGLTLLPVLYRHGGCDRRPLDGGQRRFGNDPDGFARLVEGAEAALAAAGRPDDRIGIAPHSLRAVDPAALAEAAALRPGAPVHMHLAEQVAEVAEVEAHLGARPVTWLLDNAPIDGRWCLIHCTQTTPAETARLARSGAVAGLCPITESSLGDGIFDATGLQAADGTFGVGTDSNIHIALLDELRTLDYSQRLRDRSRAALATADRSTGRVLFETAAAAGARAAGRAAGVLAPGHVADILGIATGNPWVAGRRGDTVLDCLIFTGHGPRAITDLWSAGRHIVREGRHIDRTRITATYMATIARLGEGI
ncbi:formimidoylglutamate deiminase [Rhodovulum euryhalinum]|uniref:formimidoylglutamate deiminase n=1 Tax=Rhodovulum euryhalinum TaxID=35805 RepID=UPI0010492E3E|nr:formimidoylglutamate deiminase [Rhodovulum euryhalinum]